MWHFAGHRRTVDLNSFWDVVGIGSEFKSTQNAYLFIHRRLGSYRCSCTHLYKCAHTHMCTKCVYPQALKQPRPKSRWDHDSAVMKQSPFVFLLGLEPRTPAVKTRGLGTWALDGLNPSPVS